MNNGIYYVCVLVYDNVGYTDSACSEAMNFDNVAPEVNVSIDKEGYAKEV